MPLFNTAPLSQPFRSFAYAFFTLITAALLFSCNNGNDTLSGSWAAEGTEAPAQSFTLADNGTFTSINAGSQTYTHWEKDNNHLIFSNESISDTFRIISLTDTLLSLEANGNEVYYVRPDRRANQSNATIVSEECFSYHTGKDSASIHVSVGPGRVKGKLSYDFFEKDRNRGVIDGEWSGDTLFAFYRFQSEGTESVREVIFLKKADTLLEGFGPVAMKGDSVFFKDRKKLQFADGLAFTKTTCSGI